jgi:ParB family chromosome partitioning protein
MPRRGRRTAKSPGIGLDALRTDEIPAEIVALEASIGTSGGQAITHYREPLGGHWVVLALLPVDRVQATPYQRELSESHVRRLAEAMPRVGLYLDPIVAVPAEGGIFWTPNGMHRLEAMRSLGARIITALVVPEHALALRILALNTERAHGLKDRALEVVRMARALAGEDGGLLESEYAETFEEPAWLTLGAGYEQRPRLAGHAYLPIVRRCEAFLDLPLTEALKLREKRAALVLELDDAVTPCVEALHARGLRSPYLKGFLLARVQPRRERPTRVGERRPPLPFEPTLRAMIEAVRRLDVARIRPQDVATLGGAPADDAM